jgi:hypothetical protein
VYRWYNNVRAGAIALALLVLIGCNDSLVDDIAVSVELTPDRDTIVVGEISRPFSATAFNARDDAIVGALFTWRSDQPFIAQVDSLSGTVIGVTLGAAAITARAGAVSDTAQVFVVPSLVIDLQTDTLLLAPGDTMTIPVTLLDRAGVNPTVTFTGGSGVASIDPNSGLVTALTPGVVGFQAFADSASAIGGIQVLALQDTGFGTAYFGLAGGVNNKGRHTSRGFNHPTLDGRSAFNLNAVGAGGQQVATLLIDSVTALGQRSIGALPTSATVSGQDPVCFPPASWVFYKNMPGVPTITGLSLAGGTVTITSIAAVSGGRVISGRLDAVLQRPDIEGPDGQISVLGTFVVPVINLGSCPQ